MPKIIVIGGTGFVGSEFCRLAVLAGHQVIGISRSGKLKNNPSWAGAVAWVAGDVFQPDGWRHTLTGADAVIHTIGIIVENPKKGITFKKLNEEAAVIVAKAAEQAGIPSFVFISAYGKPPLVKQEYFAAKKRAEEAIAQMNLRASFLRPSLIYGQGRPISYLFVWPLFILAPVLGDRFEILNLTSATEVASAALAAALNPEVKGVIGIAAIKKLARDFTAAGFHSL